jgi:hypothetical protein
MFSKKYKIRQKFFAIRTYNKLSKIETVVDSIAQKNEITLQLSVLGKLTNNKKITKKELQKSTSEIQQKLRFILAKKFKFGYFYNPEIGFLFIAGHLTATFLNKVNERELASMPAGLLGIFRGLDGSTAEINNYFRDLKNDNYCLIIRGESNALKTIEPALNIS